MIDSSRFKWFRHQISASSLSGLPSLHSNNFEEERITPCFYITKTQERDGNVFHYC